LKDLPFLPLAEVLRTHCLRGTGVIVDFRQLHGLVGYRALAIDYTQDGPSKNNLDLILHGPVVGLSFRW
jgi:hypothetical protein